MNLILFGFKGCGKTHFGKRLAAKMGRPFIDTDDLLIALDGKKRNARAIHTALGESGFRALEKEALYTLRGLKNTVIALGGGTLLDPENRELIQKVGALIYLEASPETLRRRIFKDEIPSFIDKSDPEASFLKMIQERKPIYESMPARRVNVDALDEAGVLAALSSILLLEDAPNGF